MVKLSRSGLMMLFSVIIGFAFLWCVTAGRLPGPFKVIPQPRGVELVGGTGLESGGLPGFLPSRIIVYRNLIVRYSGVIRWVTVLLD
ncbi:MAG: hypothetical protein AMJ43_08955 [Coxiella sp. DG_40]|nr:MAG: hypothetical protein AMJ43_08955 [Coxiella sp. DG_40]